MILFYAMGAGYGHLTRTMHLIHQFNLGAVGLLSNSPFAATILKSQQHKIASKVVLIRPPKFVQHKRGLMRYWLKDVIHQSHISDLYIDAFPSGIQGELPRCTHIPTTYLARLLKWTHYKTHIQYPIHFHQCYEMEPLEPVHHQWIKRHTLKYKKVFLAHPASASHTHCSSGPCSLGPSEGGLTPGYCLVIHSGSPEEQLQLIRYATLRMQYAAQALNIVLVSPVHPAGLATSIMHFKNYPAHDFLAGAQVVVSAAGFNIMRDMENYPDKIHWVLPFERKFDDQFSRFARYKENTARYTSASKFGIKPADCSLRLVNCQPDCHA